jgi:hypothetical protein
VDDKITPVARVAGQPKASGRDALLCPLDLRVVQLVVPNVRRISHHHVKRASAEGLRSCLEQIAFQPEHLRPWPIAGKNAQVLSGGSVYVHAGKLSKRIRSAEKSQLVDCRGEERAPSKTRIQHRVSRAAHAPVDQGARLRRACSRPPASSSTMPYVSTGLQSL